MKKKVVALSLVVAMVVMNSVVALGDTTSSTWDKNGFTPANGDKKNVTVDFSVTDTEKYSVNITWGGLQYTYGSTGEWNPSDHSYAWTDGTGGWKVKDGSSNTISVVNHSNRDVYGKYSFSVDSEFNTNYKPKNLNATFNSTGVGATLTSDKFTLPSAVMKETTAEDLQSNVTVDMSGTLGKATSETGKTVGQVTITLSALDNIS